MAQTILSRRDGTESFRHFSIQLTVLRRSGQRVATVLMRTLRFMKPRTHALHGRYFESNREWIDGGDSLERPDCRSGGLQ